MDKITNLKTLLSSAEVSALTDDIDFYPAVQEVKEFLEKIDKPGLLSTLSNDKKVEILSIIDKVDDCAKSYLATKNNGLCLAINHYILDGYDVLLSVIDDFEKKFADKINDIDAKIANIGEEIDKKMKLLKVLIGH